MQKDIKRSINFRGWGEWRSHLRRPLFKEIMSNNVVYPPCRKCGASHGMGIETMSTGKIEPMDLCKDCLFSYTVYRPSSCPEKPIAIDMKASEAMKEYHRKSYVQINVPKEMNLTMKEKEDLILRDLINSCALSKHP